MKTENSKKLDIIKTDIQSHLSPLGFKTKGHKFNKKLDNDLLQVIDLQMASYSSFLYGSFTVELGVFIPEIYKFYFENLPIPSFISANDCQFSCNRLSGISQMQYDKWWDLHEDISSISKEIWDLLQEYGLPYLSRFTTREAILTEWQMVQEKGYKRIILPMMIILVTRGEKEKAEKIIENNIESFIDEKGYINEFCNKLGINLPK